MLSLALWDICIQNIWITILTFQGHVTILVNLPYAISYWCCTGTILEIFSPKPVHAHTQTHTKWFYILSHAMYCIGQNITVQHSVILMLVFSLHLSKEMHGIRHQHWTDIIIEMAKFDPQPMLNPWTDCHRIWNTWLRRRFRPPQKIRGRSDQGFLPPYTRNIHPKPSKVYFAFFSVIQKVYRYARWTDFHV